MHPLLLLSHMVRACSETCSDGVRMTGNWAEMRRESGNCLLLLKSSMASSNAPSAAVLALFCTRTC